MFLRGRLPWIKSHLLDGKTDGLVLEHAAENAAERVQRLGLKDEAVDVTVKKAERNIGGCDGAAGIRSRQRPDVLGGFYLAASMARQGSM